MTGKGFTPSQVRNDPLIYSGRAVKRMKASSDGSSGTTDQAGVLSLEVTEHKGDLLIRELWQNGTDSVHDMRVLNTDALSYVRRSPEKCFHEAERGKKKMYLEACLQQR